MSIHTGEENNHKSDENRLIYGRKLNNILLCNSSKRFSLFNLTVKFYSLLIDTEKDRFE